MKINVVLEFKDKIVLNGKPYFDTLQVVDADSAR